jgi:hypothetical protein
MQASQSGRKSSAEFGKGKMKKGIFNSGSLVKKVRVDSVLTDGDLVV